MEKNEFIRRLFEAAKARAEGLGDFACEACLSESESFEAEVLKGELLKYEVSDSRTLHFRVLLNGRVGAASTQVLDEASIDLLVEGALDNAGVIESEDEQFMFPGSDAYPELKLYDPALAQMTAAEKIDLARRLEALTLAQDKRIDRVSGCAVFYECGAVTLVNTLGLNVSSRSNVLGGYVDAVAREGERVNSGFAMFFAMDPSGIALEKTAEKAAREAVNGLSGAPVPSGSYRTLLRRDVAGTLLGTFSGIFSAENAQRGLSRLKGREGEVVAAECVTITDDPHRPDSAASSPFDGEGVATTVKNVIEGGRLMTLLHNLKTAHKQGVETTGNAAAGGSGVAPGNLLFAPSETSFEQMLSALGDGLLITELQGMHAGANPITGDFSLAAKGFAVRGGAIAEPVAQITVAGNFYELLRDIEAVGADLELRAPGASGFGSPSLLVKKLSVAGE